MKLIRNRLVLIAYASILIVLVFSGRIFYLQVVEAENLQKQVVEQRVQQTEESPKRGDITDRNGYTLARSELRYDVNAHPNLIKSEQAMKNIAEGISNILDIEYGDIKEIVSGDSFWENVKSGVNVSEAQKLREAGFPGIELVQNPRRKYPFGHFGSSILGSVNEAGEPISGVEQSLNEHLSGTPGYQIAERDQSGDLIPVGFESGSDPVDGQNVQLTIDHHIQSILEERLIEGVEEMNAKYAHAIIMDPKTGEILAMSSVPDFDPNKYGEYDEDYWRLNPATQTYEPGSTMKPIYMAGALEKGIINENSTWYDDSGSISVRGSTISNWDRRPLYDMTLEDIIVNSSNVGMVEIANQTSEDQAVDFLSKTGFGQRTGIEIGGEERGIFPTVEELENDPVRHATISYGYGLSATPIQVIKSIGEIVNGGYSLQPNLVSSIKDEIGNIYYDPDNQIGERIYSKNTSELMRKYMKSMLDTSMGGEYQLEEVEGGGKTGTSWPYDQELGGYNKSALVGSFVGFAPYDDPEYSMIVVVEEPEGVDYGNQATLPIFKDVMDQVIDLDREVEKKDKVVIDEVSLPDVRWMMREDGIKELSDKGLKIDGGNPNEVITDMNYKKIYGNVIVTLETDPVVDGEFVNMPILLGKEKEELAEIIGEVFEVNVMGEGRVEGQPITPGRHLINEMENNLLFWLGD